MRIGVFILFFLLMLVCHPMLCCVDVLELPWFSIRAVTIGKDQCTVETIDRFVANHPQKLSIECLQGEKCVAKVAINPESKKVKISSLAPATAYTLTPIASGAAGEMRGENYSWEITTLPAFSGKVFLKEVYLSNQVRFTLEVSKEANGTASVPDNWTRQLWLSSPEEADWVLPLTAKFSYSSTAADYYCASVYLPPGRIFEFHQGDPADLQHMKYRFTVPPFRNLRWCELPLLNEKQAPLFQGHLAQDIVHPSVLFSEKKIHGYNIWLSATPWPQCINGLGKITGEYYENPNVFHADLENGGMPVRFTGIANNPLLERNVAGNGFNSDSDLLLANDRFFCITRQRNYDFTRMTNRFVIQHSENGSDWSRPVQVLTTGKGEPECRSLSPMLVAADNKFYCYVIERTKDNKNVKSIDVYQCDDLTQPDALKFLKSGTWSNQGISVWHGDIFAYQGEFYMVFNTVDGGATYLARSANHIDWDVYPVPLNDLAGSYHPSGFVRESNHHLIVYTAYLGRKNFSREYPTGHRVAVHDFGDFDRILSEFNTFLPQSTGSSVALP